jgi:hypothetical protein
VGNQVYLLYHIRDEGQLLLVGVYRSEEDAESAIERLRTKPGFEKYPDKFEYHAYDLGVDIWSEGFRDDESVEDAESRSVHLQKPN